MGWGNPLKRGVRHISFSPKEKKLSGSINFFYFPGKKTHFIALGNEAALTITHYDDTTIVGKYRTPKPMVDDFNLVTISFDVSFQVNLGKSKAAPAPSKKNNGQRCCQSSSKGIC